MEEARLRQQAEKLGGPKTVKELIARGQKAMEVIGPVPALEAEMVATHRDFWSRR